MSLLESIDGPRDLRGLSATQLTQLSEEIRAFLIHQVSRTGGHLGPNLGVVELTLALHRIFDSPADPIIFDTGHQSYVHKIVTGRRDAFPTLKQKNGLSGYPSRTESEHDWVENQHASTSLAYAEGLAKAFRLRHNRHHVVAVIGDGALTGGMAWEALNNIAAGNDLPLVIVVNDNGRSYTPTVGGLARHLTGLRTNPRYEQVLDVVKRQVNRTPVVGNAAYDVLHGIKVGLKDVIAPQGMYSDLGMKYVGPIDGHDVAALERALQQAKQFGGPVLVHVLTRKGRGFPAAENNEEDQFHTVGKIDEVTGLPLSRSEQTTWTDVFAEELLRIGRSNEHVVAITAAMLYPTGLHRFAAAFPERVFDVGIAEQHAVTSAAGMAMGGLHPVVALYATFLNRAFDQVLMDVALHGCGVTFVLDRAGITGSDGASHNGMWDMSMLQLVPGLHLAAPRDGTRLREALAASIEIDDAPSVVRYSKEKVPDDIPAIERIGGVDVLRREDAGSSEPAGSGPATAERDDRADRADPAGRRSAGEHDGVESKGPHGVLVVGYGQLVGTALAVADRLADQGIAVMVVDPVWALPVDPALIDLAAQHDLVVTIEDNLVVGGCGARLLQELSAHGVRTPVRCFGIPQRFLPHASRSELLDDIGLGPQQIARSVVETVVEAAHDTEDASFEQVDQAEPRLKSD